jgi:hypothetical protein
MKKIIFFALTFLLIASVSHGEVIEDGKNTVNMGVFHATIVTAYATTTSTISVTTSESPASGDACDAGEITWDASYIYICTASGAWKRAALTGGY